MPPRRRLVASLAAMIAATTLTAACVTERVTTVPARADDPRPPVSTADDEEKALLAGVETYDDPDLAAYLASIVDRLSSEDERGARPSPIAIIVLRDPTLNAFAMPTGHIFVHTGLLVRVENEAQLATILARELTHVTRGHADSQRGRAVPMPDVVGAIARTISTATAIPAGREEAGSAVLSPVFRAILGKPLAIAYAAAVEGYGASLARDADAGAVERLRRAAYDAKDAARVFEHLRAAARAGGAVERFFYGRETALAERTETVTRLLTAEGAAATARPETAAPSEMFTSVRAPMLRDNAKLELAAGRFRLAQEQLDRALAAAPKDPRARLLYGNLYRLRAQRARSVADQDELARQAFTSYEECIALDPEMTEVHRQLGLLYYQLHQIARAREAFARYLALRPGAPDAARVREYLGESDP